jgi:hypothetical protein
MSRKRQPIDDLLAEVSDEAEAAELTTDPDAPLPPHVKVSRPGRVRSKVLQIRLNPEEMAAVEAVAERRGLPVSTVAREQLLRLVQEEREAIMSSPADARAYEIARRALVEIANRGGATRE